MGRASTQWPERPREDGRPLRSEDGRQRTEFRGRNSANRKEKKGLNQIDSALHSRVRCLLSVVCHRLSFVHRPSEAVVPIPSVSLFNFRPQIGTKVDIGFLNVEFFSKIFPVGFNGVQ